MVKLDKIYTKGGDNGKTSLGNGKRVNKFNKRIVAVGSLEELNAHIGICLNECDNVYKRLFTDIQNDLFDMGADLIMPLNKEKKALRITSIHISKIENKIDKINDKLPTLKSFILPGGSLLSSRLHLARTVCRRCEINIIKLNYKTPVNKNILKYINRLSDLLFVIAREINTREDKEILWKPGKNMVK